MFFVAGTVGALGIQGEQDRESPRPPEDGLSREPHIRQIITDVHSIAVLISIIYFVFSQAPISHPAVEN